MTSGHAAATLLLALALAGLVAVLAQAQASAGYVYIVEYSVYSPQGVLIGSGRIVYPLGGEPTVVYAAGVAANPRGLAALIDSIAGGRYSPAPPLDELEPIFNVVAYSIAGSTLPAVCSLEDTPVTGLTVAAPGGGVARGNAWIAPGSGVPVAGVLVGEGRGGTVFRVDFYLGEAPEVVCGRQGSPMVAAVVGLASGAALLGGVGVIASRLLRGSYTGLPEGS